MLISVIDGALNDEINLTHLEAEMAGIHKECQCTIKTDDEIIFEKIMITAWQRGDDGGLQVRSPWELDPSITIEYKQ